MAEFLPEETAESDGGLVGGISISREEFEGLDIDNIEFSTKTVNTYNLVRDFSEGTIFKLELSIADRFPEVSSRMYNHTYDDVKTQLEHIEEYNQKHNKKRDDISQVKQPEGNSVIAILGDVSSDKTTFYLHNVNGSIKIRPYQLEAVYPCFDLPLSTQVNLNSEVLSYMV